MTSEDSNYVGFCVAIFSLHPCPVEFRFELSVHTKDGSAGIPLAIPIPATLCALNHLYFPI